MHEAAFSPGTEAAFNLLLNFSFLPQAGQQPLLPRPFPSEQGKQQKETNTPRSCWEVEQCALGDAAEAEGADSPAHPAEGGDAASGNEAADVQGGCGETGLEHSPGQHQG